MRDRGTQPKFRRESGLEIQFFTNKKLWGHGRHLQIMRAVYCHFEGHDYSPWHYDWPWDVPEYWEEIDQPYREPYEWERLVWARHCRRGCGHVEMAMACIMDMERMRDDVAGLP